jgi:hypothetical protein
MAAKKTNVDDETDNEKEVEKWRVTLDELVEVGSFDDAVALLNSHGVELVGSDGIEEFVGDGFDYVEKAALVNIPFVIMKYVHRMSPTYDVPMVQVWGMTATNRRVKFVDFGTGFREQIATYEKRSGRSAVGLILKNGLVANTYDTQDATGKDIKATTYRINFGD